MSRARGASHGVGLGRTVRRLPDRTHGNAATYRRFGFRAVTPADWVPCELQLQIIRNKVMEVPEDSVVHGRFTSARRSDRPTPGLSGSGLAARAAGPRWRKCSARSRRGRPGSLWRKLMAFLGPGYLVAVGYMDPGNWATSLAGGSKFGYALLTVALLSNLMAILLQALCARLGIAPAATWRRPAATRFRARCRGRSGCWRRSRSAPPIWPR